MNLIVAPTHILGRQLQIVNATLSEALMEQDPLASALRDVLDDLIYYHNRVFPVSIFSHSQKITINETAVELYALNVCGNIWIGGKNN